MTAPDVYILYTDHLCDRNRNMCRGSTIQTKYCMILIRRQPAMKNIIRKSMVSALILSLIQVPAPVYAEEAEQPQEVPAE